MDPGICGVGGARKYNYEHFGKTNKRVLAKEVCIKILSFILLKIGSISCIKWEGQQGQGLGTVLFNMNNSKKYIILLPFVFQ